MKSLKILMMAVLTILSVAVFAQDSTARKSKTTKQKSGKMTYSCPMHPEVTSDKSGKCPKCGMDLVQSDKDKMKMYVCPMHPDVTSDKPGKCSKCGMALVEKKKDNSSQQH
jgi:transcription initiation factor IIE alpha subunit